MNKCSGNDGKGHNLTAIYWLKKGDATVAKNFMCRACLRTFHLEEVCEIDAKLKEYEKHLEDHNACLDIDDSDIADIFKG
jgi:hypothetical protein